MPIAEKIAICIAAYALAAGAVLLLCRWIKC